MAVSGTATSYSLPYYNAGFTGYPYPYYANPSGMQKYRVGLYTAPEAPDTTSDLAALQEIHEKSKPLVLKTEALANKIFPGDGKPIIQGNILRTKFGKSILIVEFRKRSKETTALSTLKQFSFSVAFLARP